MVDEVHTSHFSIPSALDLPHKFNLLVSEACLVSGETHKRIKKILMDLNSVVQIKDNLAVHGKGLEDDHNLEVQRSQFNY